MTPLPDIEDIYPHEVSIKHRGEPVPVSLRIMRWLEGRGIMINQDFYLDISGDPDRILVRFRRGKTAKKLKAVKKEISRG